MVERFNRTLAEGLAKFCSSQQDDWDTFLSPLLMAYRSAEHETTGYTPARLMLGRELRLPIDLLTGRPPPEDHPISTADFSRKLEERLAAVFREVRTNLLQSGKVMKQRTDKTAKAAPYAAGDQVWLYNPRRKKGLSTSLMRPWEGPYIVENRLSDVTFRIRATPRAKAKVVHANRLWKFHGPGDFSWDAGDTLRENDSVTTDDDDENATISGAPHTDVNCTDSQNVRASNIDVHGQLTIPGALLTGDISTGYSDSRNILTETSSSDLNTVLLPSRAHNSVQGRRQSTRETRAPRWLSEYAVFPATYSDDDEDA